MKKLQEDDKMLQTMIIKTSKENITTEKLKIDDAVTKALNNEIDALIENLPQLPTLNISTDSGGLSSKLFFY